MKVQDKNDENRQKCPLNINILTQFSRKVSRKSCRAQTKIHLSQVNTFHENAPLPMQVCERSHLIKVVILAPRAKTFDEFHK